MDLPCSCRELKFTSFRFSNEDKLPTLDIQVELPDNEIYDVSNTPEDYRGSVTVDGMITEPLEVVEASGNLDYRDYVIKITYVITSIEGSDDFTGLRVARNDELVLLDYPCCDCDYVVNPRGHSQEEMQELVAHINTALGF
jgi:hypothetical protein